MRSRAAAKKLGNANANANGSGNGGANGAIRGAALEPVGVVRRQLVSPNGELVVVDVPVYPPFRLESPSERASRRSSGGEEAEGNASG